MVIVCVGGCLRSAVLEPVRDPAVAIVSAAGLRASKAPRAVVATMENLYWVSVVNFAIDCDR